MQGRVGLQRSTVTSLFKGLLPTLSRLLLLYSEPLPFLLLLLLLRFFISRRRRSRNTCRSVPFCHRGRTERTGWDWLGPTTVLGNFRLAWFLELSEARFFSFLSPACYTLSRSESLAWATAFLRIGDTFIQFSNRLIDWLINKNKKKNV